MTLRPFHLLSLFSVTLLTGCMGGPAFMKKSGPLASERKAGSTLILETSATASGGVAARVEINGANAQQIAASESSAIAGAAVVFPPGSLAVSTTIELAPAAPLTDGDLTTVGVDSAVVASGTPVSITSSEKMDAVNPFTLALPIPSAAGLRLQGVDPERLSILYKLERISSGETVAGVFTANQLRVNNGKVEFETSWFGTYQVIITERPVVQAREVAAEVLEKPAPKIISRPLYWVSGMTLATYVDDLPPSSSPMGWLALGVDSASATPTQLPPGIATTVFKFEESP